MKKKTTSVKLGFCSLAAPRVHVRTAGRGAWRGQKRNRGRRRRSSRRRGGRRGGAANEEEKAQQPQEDKGQASRRGGDGRGTETRCARAGSLLGRPRPALRGPAPPRAARAAPCGCFAELGLTVVWRRQAGADDHYADDDYAGGQELEGHAMGMGGLGGMDGEAAVDPEALAEITRTVQVEMAEQVSLHPAHRHPPSLTRAHRRRACTCYSPPSCCVRGASALTRGRRCVGQLKMITQEMARLKSELYSENGGLAEIQKSLETLKGTPMLGCVPTSLAVCVPAALSTANIVPPRSWSRVASVVAGSMFLTARLTAAAKWKAPVRARR